MAKKLCNKKEEILQIARKRFAAENYEVVSLSSLAKEVGVSKPALYYYFSSKEELYVKVLVDIFNELKVDLKNALKNKLTIEERFRKLIQSYLKILVEKNDSVMLFSKKIILGDSEKLKYLMELKKEIVGLIEPLMKEVLESRKMKKKIDSYIATKMLLGAIHALIGEEMLKSRNRKLSVGQVTEYTMSLLFK